MEDSHIVLRSVADISKFLYKLGLILGVLYLMSLKKKTSTHNVFKSFWSLFAVL